MHGDGRYTAVEARPGGLVRLESGAAAGAELFRHFIDPGVSQFEVIRRVGVVEVTDLDVLDPCDSAVRAELGVTEEDLTSDDYAVCQRIADIAADHFDGILAPSVALHGRQTPRHLPKPA